MSWNIITDSACDLIPGGYDGKEAHISSVPFLIRIEGTEYVDDESLDTARLLDAMEHIKTVGQTSCPTPQAWAREYAKADYSIAITISSHLSGSLNSALTAKKMAQERYPEKKIEVIDSHSVGPEIVLCVGKILEMIDEGKKYEEVVCETRTFFHNSHIVFALSSFDNLVKSGRMNRVMGFVAGKFKIWGIGVGNDEGSIAIKGKAKGQEKAIRIMLYQMEECGFTGGHVVISHCHNPSLADKLKFHILKKWKAKVTVLPTRGICSYYAERGGVIVGFSGG